jgi:hypothetical protein
LFYYDFHVSPNDGVRVESARDFPPVYEYLRQGAPNRAFLELPAVYNDIRSYRHIFYQTAHWRPDVNGLSAWLTPAALLLNCHLDGFPDDYGLNLLRISPTMTLVVHLDQYNEGTRKQWENADLEKYGFNRQGRFGNALVWERVTSPPASASHLRIMDYDIAPSEQSPILHLSADDSRPWSHPELGIDQLTVRATYTDGTTREIQVPFRLPPLIVENEMATAEIPLAGLPLRAVARVEVSGRWILSHPLTLSPTQTVTTSLNPAAGLSAKLGLVDGMYDGMHVPRSTKIPVHANVENTGSATWLTPSAAAALQKSVGFVSGGLNWFKRADVQNIQIVASRAAVLDGRLPIPYDMPPGSVATLSSEIPSPDQPGEYTVFLEMVSDGVCWFADKNNSDVRRYNVVVE